MKQLGNLAMVCANRHDTLMQILDGLVTIHLGRGPDRTALTVDWHDDEKIRKLVLELNHGRFREEMLTKGDAAA